jgi:ATP-dependent helicase HrpA
MDTLTHSSSALADRLDGLTLRDRHRLARRLERARRLPGDRRDQELASIGKAVERAELRRATRASVQRWISYPGALPVSERRGDILAAIRDHQVVVIAGETGSGKTTQIPKMCLELGRGIDGMIGHTQPRRIAARTVAERLAEEMRVEVGGAVGYAVRFTDTVSDQTLVKVMTDGILLAEIPHDRRLYAYDTIIVDEAHERSLNIDFLLGYLAQLLPRRPDLKVIITSATIDTARFAAHFGAPVVEVSGRTYPVEVRYRPLTLEASPDSQDSDAEERDINEAIVDAVHELAGEGPGDMLVFLPGERDIRDAAEALRASGPDDIEVLPLYARLTAAEQHRVFRPHPGRRVVLATNVAETSLTVPGIHYVIDTGLARISRFNHRTKVQRLPIERISRASANQRAGRCGRIAPGTCIRLYSEGDYEDRPEFTDPEILRTNLASVMLQMAAIGLGGVEAFPFLQPPDRRSVADGRAVLEELDAIRPDHYPPRLTEIGRRLARLPLDPRLGRMLLEAERRDCLREVTIIAAALSIQDPRERPAERIQGADEAHSRFQVAGSDFLSYVRLWDYLAEIQAGLSGNQFRRRCRAEYLNVLRVREWQDLVGQIRQIYRAEGIHPNIEAAPDDQVHQSLLAGLLSQIGMKDRIRGDYQGARNTRWRIGRPSALARSQPAWAMAAALVETEKTWARTVARIEPAWAERQGSHLLKHSYSEPWWDSKRGEARVDERATLYGLPVVSSRPASLARLDPPAARDMFIRHGLVEREWSANVPALDRVAGRIEAVRALEERVRRRDLMAGDERLYEFYDSRIPADVTGAGRFMRWWARTAKREPELLDVPLSVLVNPDAGPIELSDYPDRWEQGDLSLRLRYRYAPGEPDDGVTVEVPLLVLNRITSQGFDWGIPGYRTELVAALVRMLPKPLRRNLGPAADVARDLLNRISPTDGPLLAVVARALARLAGLPVDPGIWDVNAIPAHLRVSFDVIDEQRRVLGRGRYVGELRRSLRGALRAAIARAVPDLERHGATSWDWGPALPRMVERGELRGYPAMVDEGESVGIAVLDTPAAQADSMWRGTRRLLLLRAPVPSAHVQRRLTNETKLALARSPLSLNQLLEDCATAVAEELIVAHGGPPFEAHGFADMEAEARHVMGDRVATLATIAGGVLASAELVQDQVVALERSDRTGAFAYALADVRRQVDDLVHRGFVAATGGERLGNLLRYFDAASRRLERLAGDLRRDASRQAVIDRVEARYEAALDEYTSARLAGEATTAAGSLAEVRWMIQELRVSLWAQNLGTSGPISEERITRALDHIRARG